MDNEDLKKKFTDFMPSVVFDETGEWLNISIESKSLLAFAGYIRNEPNFCFDYLFCITCVDWKTHLTMVYHFSSTIHRHNIVLKINLDRQMPDVETLSHIWKTAEFNEREAYEMFGVNFLNHPDLRLLILPDGWEGKRPMLKDFEDPINMIRL